MAAQITHEEIAVAAYYLHMNQAEEFDRDNSAEANWYAAEKYLEFRDNPPTKESEPPVTAKA